MFFWNVQYCWNKIPDWIWVINSLIFPKLFKKLDSTVFLSEMGLPKFTLVLKMLLSRRVSTKWFKANVGLTWTATGCFFIFWEKTCCLGFSKRLLKFLAKSGVVENLFFFWFRDFFVWIGRKICSQNGHSTSVRTCFASVLILLLKNFDWCLQVALRIYYLKIEVFKIIHVMVKISKWTLSIIGSLRMGCNPIFCSWNWGWIFPKTKNFMKFVSSRTA